MPATIAPPTTGHEHLPGRYAYGGRRPRGDRERGLRSREGDEPQCVFRPLSLAQVRRYTIGPTLEGVVQSVALPVLHRRHLPFGHETPPPFTSIGTGLVEQFVPTLLAPGAARAREFVDGLRDTGMSLDCVLLALMREAETLLERWFEQDRCSSLDVTLGVCQLRTLALELSRGQHRVSRDRPAAQRRACIVSPAGDGLRFDSVLHECYLLMAGWQVEKLESLSPDEVAARTRDGAFELALCVLNDQRLQRAAGALAQAVRTAGGRTPPLMIGIGPGFGTFTHRPRQAGLDAVVCEPAQTLLFAANNRYH